MRWHGVALDCPNCNVPAVFQIAAFSADLEFSFGFRCPKCNEPFTWHVYATALAHKALMDDLLYEKMKRLERKHKGLIDPPLAKPETFTLEDVDELKAFHILPDEPEQGVA